MNATSEPSMVRPITMEAMHMAMIELMGVPVLGFTCGGSAAVGRRWGRALRAGLLTAGSAGACSWAKQLCATPTCFHQREPKMPWSRAKA